jgi:hypothetical protein
LCLSALPDNYRGKYVFRNGIAGAIYLADEGARPALMILSGANAQAPPPDCAYLLNADRVTEWVIQAR